jgi:hypothetical protein
MPHLRIDPYLAWLAGGVACEGLSAGVFVVTGS